MIPDPSKSILEGAIQVSGWNSVRTDSIFRMYFDALAQKYHFSLTEPFASLPQEAKDVILYGTKGEKLKMTYNRGTGMGVLEQPFEGIIPQPGAPLPGDTLRRHAQGAGGVYVHLPLPPAVMGTGCRIWPGQSLWEDWGCRNSAASPW